MFRSYPQKWKRDHIDARIDDFDIRIPETSFSQELQFSDVQSPRKACRSFNSESQVLVLFTPHHSHVNISDKTNNSGTTD